MAVQAVEVAAAILEAVAQHGPVGVSQISRMTGTPKATAQRMLVTWNELGWIRKETTQPITWSLTSRMLQLGSAHDPVVELKAIARPELERLSEELGGETVHLAVQSSTTTCLIDRVEGTKSVRTHYPIGGTSPLYATATGNAMLSRMSEAEVQRLIAHSGMHPVTPHTVQTIDALRTVLETGRMQGYFTVEGTNHAETSAIAAPIPRSDGGAAGAISISLPTLRVTPDLAATYGAAVRDTANNVAVLLEQAHKNQ